MLAIDLSGKMRTTVIFLEKSRLSSARDVAAGRYFA
jgi:hypothetical protein